MKPEQNAQGPIQEVFQQFVVPSYARFDIALDHGQGSYVWDTEGKRYLDLAGGIAVNALGHAHPEITAALIEQSQRLVHISNLYYNELQGKLARRLVDLIGPGRIFFANSGAEANEGLFKLARRVGNDAGRHEIITTFDSFHGRTLAGIAATGQEKVKKGFGPPVPGFRHVPFNDLGAMRDAVTDVTAAILIEAVQGESGITVATPEYLLGLRKLCDERGLLLLFDEVQAGHFRTGRFHSWQRILDLPGKVGVPPAASGILPDASSPGKADSVRREFLPDGISMAKALGGGFPMGAFWVNEKCAGALGPGAHASTFGGTPLACAVALRILDVIEQEHLAENARETGAFLLENLRTLAAKYPKVLQEARGLGLMIGLEFQAEFNAVEMVKRLHQSGVLTVPAAASVIRLLPALNLTRTEAEEGIRVIADLVESLVRL